MPGGRAPAAQAQPAQVDMKRQDVTSSSDRATAASTARSSASGSTGGSARHTSRRGFTWFGCGGSPAIAPGTADPGDPTLPLPAHGYTQSAPASLHAGAGQGAAGTASHKANNSAPAAVPASSKGPGRSAMRGTRSVETRHAFHKLTSHLKGEVEKGLSYGLNPDFRVPLVVRTLELALNGSDPLTVEAITSVPGLTTLLRYSHEQLSIAAGLDPIPLLQGRVATGGGQGEILAMGPESGGTSPAGSSASSTRGSPYGRGHGGEGAKGKLQAQLDRASTGQAAAAAATSSKNSADLRLHTGPGIGPLRTLPTRSPVTGGPGSRGGLHSATAGDDKKEAKWHAHLSHLSSCSDGFDGFGEYAADLEREEREGEAGGAAGAGAGEGEGGGGGGDVSRAELDRGIRVEVIMRQPGGSTGPSPRDPVNPPAAALHSSITSAGTTLVLPGGSLVEEGQPSTPPRSGRKDGTEGVTGVEEIDSEPASAASNRGRRRLASDSSAFGGLPPTSAPRSAGARSAGPGSVRSHVPRLSFEGPGVSSGGTGSSMLPGAVGSTGSPPHGKGPGSSLSMEYSFQDEFVQELARQALEREGIAHKPAQGNGGPTGAAGDLVQALLRPSSAFVSPEAQAILAELQVMPTFAHESQLSPSDGGRGKGKAGSMDSPGIRVKAAAKP